MLSWLRGRDVVAVLVGRPVAGVERVVVDAVAALDDVLLAQPVAERETRHPERLGLPGPIVIPGGARVDGAALNVELAGRHFRDRIARRRRPRPRPRSTPAASGSNQSTARSLLSLMPFSYSNRRPKLSVRFRVDAPACPARTSRSSCCGRRTRCCRRSTPRSACPA